MGPVPSSVPSAVKAARAGFGEKSFRSTPSFDAQSPRLVPLSRISYQNMRSTKPLRLARRYW